MAALIVPGTAYEQKALLNDIVTDPAHTFMPLLETRKTPPLPLELEKIAWCESRGRQFDDDGKPLRGKNNYDVGKFQVNILYWGEEAQKLGHDLFTEEGNEAMALVIYQKRKTEPWKWSRSCWGAT